MRCKYIVLPLLLSFSIYFQTQAQTPAAYPRLLVSDGEKSSIIQKIEQRDWAESIYSDMNKRVTPYVEA